MAVLSASQFANHAVHTGQGQVHGHAHPLPVTATAAGHVLAFEEQVGTVHENVFHVKYRLLVVIC